MEKKKQKQIRLIKGEYIRVKGFVTMYAPSDNKKKGGQWIGGSSWTEKNPLIRVGKCKHKPIKKEIFYLKDLFTHKKKRYYFKGRTICSDCGYLIKIGKESISPLTSKETGIRNGRTI